MKKLARYNFYGSGRVEVQAEASGEYCRIADLPEEIRQQLFEPVPRRDFDDDDNDDA